MIGRSIRNYLSCKLRNNENSILKVKQNYLVYNEELWTAISDYFILPPLRNILGKICKGCIEITWIVPITIACTINLKATSYGCSEFCRKRNIIRIMMGDKVVYNEVYDNDKDEDKESDIPVAYQDASKVRIN